VIAQRSYAATYEYRARLFALKLQLLVPIKVPGALAENANVHSPPASYTYGTKVHLAAAIGIRNA
jgi:hypothetical protein